MTAPIRSILWAAVAAILCLFTTAPDAVAQRQVPQSREQMQLSFAPLVKAAAPAVVNIYSRQVVRSRAISPLFNDPFFRRFFGDRFGFGVPRERVQNSLGSGVIVDAEGTIVTNHHVIAGGDEIIVVLADRREFEAELLGSDERTDLAVLRIDPGDERLAFLELRDSDDVEVGDIVLAIGNPFGVGQTVTSGIVSALARTQVGISDLNFFIQTDAAINPGNSGGALIDMDGALIGINTAIYSKSGGSLGIGFAVPSNMVRTVIAGFTTAGKLVRPWLGAWGQPVTAEIAQSLGMERPSGVLINDVYPGGPAERAGIRVGDAVVTVNGRPVDDPKALNFRIATLPVGETAKLRLVRRGRETRVDLPLVAPVEDPPREVTELSGRHPLSGATVANMSPALADELGLSRFRPGVVILGMRRGTPAARLGFQPGDTVLEVNSGDVDSVNGLKRSVASPSARWQVVIERDGEKLNLVIGG